MFELLTGGCGADPEVIIAGGAEGVSEPAFDVGEGEPAFEVGWGEAADLGFAAGVVVPELDTRAIVEGDEEAGVGGDPAEATGDEAEFVDDEGVEQAEEVGAGGDLVAGPGLVDGAGAADAVAGFEDEDLLACAGEVGSAGEAVMTCADDDDIPGLAGEVGDGCGEAELAEDAGGWGRGHGWPFSSWRGDVGA